MAKIEESPASLRTLAGLRYLFNRVITVCKELFYNVPCLNTHLANIVIISKIHYPVCAKRKMIDDGKLSL